MSISMLQVSKIFLLAFILCEVLLASAPGLPSGVHRARSNIRATRHNLRVRGPRRRPRPTVCPPVEDYGDDDDGDTGYANGSETEEKRDLSEPPDEDSWNEDSYADSPDEDPSLEDSSVNATSANDTLTPSSFGNSSSIGNISTIGNVSGIGNISSIGNISQPINGSQFNTSLIGTGDVLNNASSIDANQTQGLNSTDLKTFASGLVAELPENGMKKSELFLGFLPDDGSSGGTRQTIAQLNSAIGSKAAVYGWYAQAHSGVPFDGSQLLAVIDDVKACNCVFQPAVMPIGGWKGLTSGDNSQAIAIAKVMKNFTDEGIPVWLRFAHEVNYYQNDGTYQGTASDFKAGWAAVADAVKKIAPSVKMWWTPNVSSPEDYAKYEPDDMSTVDLVGIDFYPKKLSGTDFLDAMKGFHDKYAVDGRKFAIGETGLGWSGNLDDKVKWFNEICEAKASLPEFVSMAWFNFDKEYDYKIAGEPTLDQKFTSLIAT
ncbi:hypothetical protein PGT21_019917 [Puccinia graminis f. sp. tritici]|uniref:GH26 domain-containing protein n=1 Tax=Puccinia graminis f. sp. tritici TaxID=56615 RepID=A0A5B0LLM4_PUCGR|nr:hypothetical protein PGT21_019917 [Puccinia graminis f. sp. tritici]